jgi:hypothetical protein
LVAARPSDEHLLTLMDRALVERCDRRRIVHVRRRASTYQSSAPIDDVDLLLDDGQEIALVVKDLSDAQRANRTTRPEFTFDARRSIRLHRHALDSAVFGTPELWATVEQPEIGRYMLVLERVDGVPLDEAPLSDWLEAARWLGRFQRYMSGRLGSLEDMPLADYDAEYYRVWMARARSFAQYDDDRRARVARLATVHEKIVERLLALPETLVHGDFHASNILVVHAPDATRVCVLDWEMAGLGPGLLDLAALTAGTWTDTQSSRLVSAYLEALGERADALGREEDLAKALDACRVQHAVQFLGWADGWQPPSDQARDWLDTAEKAVDRLSL